MYIYIYTHTRRVINTHTDIPLYVCAFVYIYIFMCLFIDVVIYLFVCLFTCIIHVHRLSAAYSGSDRWMSSSKRPRGFRRMVDWKTLIFFHTLALKDAILRTRILRRSKKGGLLVRGPHDLPALANFLNLGLAFLSSGLPV